MKFIRENPVFKLSLGLCPTLAVTNTLENALGMGVATFIVLFASNIIISVLKEYIPESIKMPIFMVVIATFVTLIQMALHALFPGLYQQLGIYVPLIVVNCLILTRVDIFAYQSKVVSAVKDALEMGVGFIFALALLGTIREILGQGTIFGQNVLGETYLPINVLLLPAGAFLTLGFVLAFFNSRRLLK